MEYPKERYGAWAGVPQGRAYDPSQCAYEVFIDQTRMRRQCTRKKGYGDRGLFCKQHAKWHPAKEPA